MTLADKVIELTNSDDCSDQDIGKRSKGTVDTVLQTKHILSEHDDCLWDIMRDAQPGRFACARGYMSLDQHTACTFMVSTVRFYCVYCSHAPLQEQRKTKEDK